MIAGADLELEEDEPGLSAAEELLRAQPFRGWVELTAAALDEFEAEMEPARAALEALMVEAGYPDADVYVENGIVIEGAPSKVVARAWALVNHVAPRPLP